MRLLAGAVEPADGLAKHRERSREHRTRPKTAVRPEKKERHLSGPEFGPGGYLPPKASKRARKIVLREQMGYGWPLAAVAAAVLVLAAGGFYLYASAQPPRPPFLFVQTLSSVPVDGAALGSTVDPPGLQAVLVRAGGGLRAFQFDGIPPQWCAESRRLETPDAAWTLDGRLVFGSGRSLRPLRSVVHDGDIYVDFESDLPRPAPALGDQPPLCTSR